MKTLFCSTLKAMTLPDGAAGLELDRPVTVCLARPNGAGKSAHRLAGINRK